MLIAKKSKYLVAVLQDIQYSVRVWPSGQFLSANNTGSVYVPLMSEFVLPLGKF
jgi:hypothetical protein